jgi:hypothetical protein
MNYTKVFPQVLQYLKEAKVGILNMKDTYSLCVQTTARLETIIAKIDTHTISEAL